MIVDPVAIIAETYRILLPNRFDSPAANTLIVAIGLQESRYHHRQQIGGPARGFHQFERGGGVRGVLSHLATKKYARAVCVLREVFATNEAVYAALLTDDLLGCAFARLLLWSDPSPLPVIGDSAGAWDLYLRTWRPGKPHPATWDKFYSQATTLVAA